MNNSYLTNLNYRNIKIIEMGKKIMCNGYFIGAHEIHFLNKLCHLCIAIKAKGKFGIIDNYIQFFNKINLKYKDIFEKFQRYLNDEKENIVNYRIDQMENRMKKLKILLLNAENRISEIIELKNKKHLYC